MDVSRALRSPGEMFPFEESVSLDLDRDDFTLSGPVVLRGSMMGVGESVVVIGEAVAEGMARCALCLTSFPRTVTVPFEETFLRKGNLQEHADEEEGVDFFTYDGESVDTAAAASSALYLNFPMRFVCSHACKGLCPLCGKDLNAGDCSCEVEEDHPFSALRSLYPDE